MREELFPKLRNELTSSAIKGIRLCIEGIKKEEHRLERLKKSDPLEIKMKIRLGTRWSESEEDVVIETDSAAETFEGAVTEGLREAMIRFCVLNRFRTDALSMYLDYVNVIAENHTMPITKFLSQEECMAIFNKLAKDGSIFDEVRRARDGKNT
jgi:hypothetical protein